MEQEISKLDLFCRVNVQADKPFFDFVAFIAGCAEGSHRRSEVTSQTLEISVHENDIYDPTKSKTGQDRWLYFRYTLEVDPIEGVSPIDYVAAIGEFLKSLWTSGTDAVAACEFEEQLPKNERRLTWKFRQSEEVEVRSVAIGRVPSNKRR